VEEKKLPEVVQKKKTKTKVIIEEKIGSSKQMNFSPRIRKEHG
jgi:hypothetical protein